MGDRLLFKSSTIKRKKVIDGKFRRNGELETGFNKWVRALINGFIKNRGFILKTKGFKLEWEPPFNSPCEGVS